MSDTKQKRPHASAETLCDIIEHVPERRVDAAAELVARPLRTNEPLGVEDCIALIKFSPPDRPHVAPLLISLVDGDATKFDCIFEFCSADARLCRRAGEKILCMDPKAGRLRYVKVIENVIDLRERALRALMLVGAAWVDDLNAIWRYAALDSEGHDYHWGQYLVNIEQRSIAKYSLAKVLHQGIEDLPEWAWPEYVKRDPPADELAQYLFLTQFQERIWAELARRNFEKVDLIRVAQEHDTLRDRAWAVLVESCRSDHSRAGLYFAANGEFAKEIPSWFRERVAREILNNNPTEFELRCLCSSPQFRGEAAAKLLRGEFVPDN